jgi:predicted nucleic acid-binding protein
VSGLTLDTGALIAFERHKRRAVRLITHVHDEGGRITVPAAVVAEWWRGQRGPAARILDAFHVEPLDEKLARRAGAALATVGEGPSAIDAIVMASAASRGDPVLTGDVDDLDRLLVVFPAVRILGVSE